jgi:hypothetical protein
MKKTIGVTEFYQKPCYERNYERNCYEEYVCECCGKKLNPKTMKQVQMLETGHWTDEQEEVLAIEGDNGVHSQGFWYIGADCYKEIMKRIKEGGETMVVEI